MDGRYLARVKRFYQIDRVIERILRYLSYVSAACVVLTAVTATANVIVQKIFSGNIPSANDYVTYMFVLIVYCAIPHVQMETDLTNVDILSVHFPAKLNMVFSIIGDIIGIAVFGFIGYALYTNSFAKYYALKTVAAIGSQGTFVLWPFALLMAISSLFMAATFVWNNVRRIVYHGEKYIPEHLCSQIGMDPPRKFGPAAPDKEKESEQEKEADRP